MPNLVKVDIQTGRVIEDNLLEFWACQTRGLIADAADGKQAWPAALLDEDLRERVKLFNTGRRRGNINSWSTAELCRLAVLMGRQKRNYKQAAARLGRTPRACQFMFREMTKAGVL